MFMGLGAPSCTPRSLSMVGYVAMCRVHTCICLAWLSLTLTWACQGTGKLSRAKFSRIITGAPGVRKKGKLDNKQIDLCFARAKAMNKRQSAISFGQFVCALIFVANVRYVCWR